MQTTVKNTKTDSKTLDCGHSLDAGHLYNGGKTGWQFVLSLDGKRKICHSCSCAQILDCGHPIGEHSYFTSGYAVTPDKRRICYTCADNSEREALRDTSKPCFAYLSGDGRKITTWTGGELMRVERETDWQIFGSRRNRGSCVTARDCHGKRWHGRGAGRSMCIKMRASKN
jgi:hypothetical protein